MSVCLKYQRTREPMRTRSLLYLKSTLLCSIPKAVEHSKGSATLPVSVFKYTLSQLNYFQMSYFLHSPDH